MSRMHAVHPEKADPGVKHMLQDLQKSIGRIPNIFLNLGNSQPALAAYMKLSELCETTSLPKKLREQIALTCAQTNSCNYCLSAHTVIAKGAGLHDDEIMNARKADASDAKSKAILSFVKKCLETRGDVSNNDVLDLKKHGVTDQEIADIVLVMTLNFLTNYFNKVVEPEIDFPQAPKLS